MSWRYVNASVRGTSHERGDVPCQDDCFVDVVTHGGGETLVAVVSDGAGSAACSQEGSGLVCEVLFRLIDDWLRDGGTPAELTRELAEGWIGDVRDAIASRAAERELTARDFACTFVAALVGSDAAVFLQIGDGAIITRLAGNYEVVFWPDGGEYANCTFFATDADWQQHLHVAIVDGDVGELAVMTDGIQRLALRFDTRSPHAPFFDPMFSALRVAPPGFAADLESPLVAFLGSDAVNARTDDDKSLVLAVRCADVADAAV